MQMATVSHHSVHRAGRADASTQAMTFINAATCAATAAPSLVVEFVIPVPSVTYAAPAPVIEYVVPAPVIEYIAPSPAVSYPSSGLMNPQFSLTADETSKVHAAVQEISEIPVVEKIQEQISIARAWSLSKMVSEDLSQNRIYRSSPLRAT